MSFCCSIPVRVCCDDDGEHYCGGRLDWLADPVHGIRRCVFFRSISLLLTGHRRNVSSSFPSTTIYPPPGKPPLDNINVRKTIIHAINKGEFVRKELQGLQQVVDNVFPLEAPYSNVDLTPRWDYDLEKAVLLSCDGIEKSSESNDGVNQKVAFGVGVGLGIPFVIAAFMALAFYHRSKKAEDELELVKKSAAVEA
jgi:Bacterial extracellular solute-binding proteins, family 5 Middle